MKSLRPAVAFLTRFPVPGAAEFGDDDVARSAGWFPVVGLLLGGIYCLAAFLLRGHLPRPVVAVLLVLLDALCTGALHFDGVADTADGFGGGKDREDVLRIMRDHAIGSYGGMALVLAVALKVTATSAVLKQSEWMTALTLTPVLGRWSILVLTASLPYARSSASVIMGMGKRSLVIGSGFVATSLIAAMNVRGWFALGLVMVFTAGCGLYCQRRISGITGDTLGANLQLCESVSLLAFAWAR